MKNCSSSACKLICGGKESAKFGPVSELFSKRKRKLEKYKDDDELSACVSDQENLVLRSLRNIPEVSIQSPLRGHEVVPEP